MTPSDEAKGPVEPEGSAAADDDASDDPEAVPEFPAEGFERWRRRSALGSVGTGIALGLQNVFAPPADQVVMVAPVPGGPPDPDRLQVILDPDDPTKSVAVIPPHQGEARTQTSENEDGDPPA